MGLSTSKGGLTIPAGLSSGNGLVGNGFSDGLLLTVVAYPSLNTSLLTVGAALTPSAIAGSYVWPLGPVTETWAWFVNGVSVAGSYVLQASDFTVSADVTLSATGLGAGNVISVGPAPVISVGSIAYGYQATLSAGTTGDVFVSPTGNDANPGTFASPKLNIQAAILANPGKSIKLRGGVYRQMVNLGTGASGTAGARTVVSRYSNEVPIISGSEVLSGLTPCVAGDAAVVGSVWASLHKVTLADSLIASADPAALFPAEVGQALPLACEFIPGPFAPCDPTAIEDWPSWTILTTGDVVASNGQVITGFQNAAITDKYTQAEIQAMSIYMYGGANLTSPTTVASFDTVNKIIRPTNTSITKANSAYNNRMLLQNIPKAIFKGSWAYVKNGDGTSTYYIWLNNSANAAAGVEYSARVTNLNLNGTSYITFEGVVFEGTASVNQANPTTHHAIVQPSGGYATNQWFYNCLIRRHHRSYNRTSMGLYAYNSHYLKVQQSSVSECYGMYGIHPTGFSGPSSPAQMTVGLWVDRCKFDRTASTAIRIYNQLFPTVSHCLWDYDVGVSPHANLIDPKLFSHGALLVGLDLSGANGYTTYQDASSINMIACYMHGNRIAGDSRTMQDQNSNDPTQSPAGAAGFSSLNPLGYILCSHFAPDAQDLTQTSNFTIGKAANTACTFRLSHNIIHGPGTIDTTAVSRDKNFIVAGAAVGTEISDTLANTYVDAANADFRIKAGSPLLSMTGTDLTSVINSLIADRPWIPTYVFSTDINGDTINWTTPPIGPAVSKSIAWQGKSWITWPTLASGSSVVGQTLDINDGQKHPGTLSLTYQWVRSFDSMRSWSSISGATSRTYLVAAPDVNSILARDADVGGSIRRTVINSTVLGSAPLSNPVTAFQYKTTVNSLNFEGPTFTVQNRPMVILVAARMNTTTLSAWTMTIGTPGRTYGTGTAISPVQTNAGANRNFTAIWAHYISAPGTGSVTVQLQQSQQINGLEVIGLYIDGTVNVTRLNSTGLTAASITHSRTTTKAYSQVLVVGAINNGALTTSLTSATTILSEASGAASDDVSVSFGWIDAPSVATYSPVLTASGSNSIILGSVIVESS